MSNHSELEKIVVAGISGRFPESENVNEFWFNLLNGVDMISENDRRWPRGIYGIPARKGTLKTNLKSFDAEFFNINKKLADRLDPQIKQLLEVTFETIIDSGQNPTQLKGRQIGVFVGASSYETYEASRVDADTVTGYDIVSSSGCTFANRISYHFDFKGPSISVDTFCSSSSMALHLALSQIRSGCIDTAIVAGINLMLDPLVSLQMQRLGTLSPEGKCQSFNAKASGYVRSEAIVSILITKKSLANKFYAEIVHTKANSDGLKDRGFSFPSGAVQESLIASAYNEARVSLNDVSYIEAHGTGTNAGDPEELNAITRAFFGKGDRKEPLLVGSVKSNMGHSEAAAGLCAVIKVVLSIYYGTIPGNLHYESPNPNICGLFDNTLQVVTKTTPLKGNIFGINSFGIGGSNVHIILKNVDTEKYKQGSLDNNPSGRLPILIPFSGRTREAVEFGLHKLTDFAIDEMESVCKNIQTIQETGIEGHKYCGYSLFHGNNGFNLTSSQIIIPHPHAKRPLWYIFPGVGAQWTGMGLQMLSFKEFRNSLKKSSECLKEFGYDLTEMLTSSSPEAMKGHEKVCYMTMGIGLIDILSSLGLQPDGMIGHSAGEWLCAYADGCINREQALLALHSKDQCLVNTEEGEMISTGLSWEKAVSECPANTYPACHNAVDNVTISGKTESIRKFATKLESEGIFVKKVESSGVAYHSPYVYPIAKEWMSEIEKILQHPKPRSDKWISTTFPESEWKNPSAQNASPEYFIKNFTSPVLFYDALKHIPSDAIVLEVSPHSLFNAVLRRALPKTVANISMMKKFDNDNITKLVSAIGDLFVLGLRPKIQNLYDDSEVVYKWPPISPLIKWNHEEKYPLLDYLKKTRDTCQAKFVISLDDEEWKFLRGHRIDGRIIFPGTGYLILVWKTLGKLFQQQFEVLDVKFQDISFTRSVILEENISISLEVQILKPSGEFVVTERKEIIAKGVISVLDRFDEATDIPLHQSDDYKILSTDSKNCLLQNDIYKEFKLTGNYDYTADFQGIKSAYINGNCAIVSWKNNWISYLDTLIQLTLLWTLGKDRCTRVPTRIKLIKINNNVFRTATAVNDREMMAMYSLHTKTISSPGIMITGIHFTQVAARIKEPPQQVINEYRFFPYLNNGFEYEASLGVHIMLSIIMENTVANSITVRSCSKYPCEDILRMIRHFANINSISMVVEPKENEYHQHAVELSIFHITSSSEKFDYEDLSHIKTNFVLMIAAKQVELDEIVFSHRNWNVVSKLRTRDGSLYLLKIREILENSLNYETLEVLPTNFSWLEKLKKLVNDSALDRIYLVSNISITGTYGLAKTIRYEIGGGKIRCVHTEEKDQFQKYFSEIEKNDLFMNIIKNDTIGTVVYVERDNIYEHRSVATENAYLNILIPGNLSSLTWIEAPTFSENEKSICQTYYASINFRDIMISIGKLLPDALPGKASSSKCVLGLEFSGIGRSGQRIMGAVEFMGIATQVILNSELSWQVPENWTLEDASTVPIAYSTAYYALVYRGKLQQGESVLITSGSGAVGQAALRICISLGCDIYVTVGSESKKQFLINEFPNLGEHKIFDSRSTVFGTEIMIQTQGKGVDVILNSLSEDKLQAALTVLGEGGRFLEIGKFDMSNNTLLGMELFLNNTTFHGILLDSLFLDSNIKTRCKVSELVSEGILTGVVKPLPRKVFHCTKAEEAFRYMSSGKHIGKVVLKIRDEETEGTESLHISLSSVPVTYFHPNFVYIIAGGLGGMGLELINWMITRGMKKVIVLCTSRGLSNSYQKLQFKKWQEDNVNIILHRESLTMENYDNFASECGQYGEVGGIFNLAMILKDAVLENQTEENFKAVLQPKLILTQVLNMFSQKYCPKLEYFVCFSSIVAKRGNLGQANYGMANSAMDEIIMERRKLNLPGLSIQWGGIADVGVLSEKLMNSKHAVIVAGTVPQSISSCFMTLDKILYFQNEFDSGIVSSFVPAPTSDKLNSESQSEDPSIYKDILKILGINEPVSDTKQNKNLGDLGIDSLMLVEIRLLFERYGFSGITSNQIRKLTLANIMDNTMAHHDFKIRE